VIFKNYKNNKLLHIVKEDKPFNPKNPVLLLLFKMITRVRPYMQNRILNIRI